MDEKKRWLNTWPPPRGGQNPYFGVLQPGVPDQQGLEQGEQYPQMPHAIEFTVQHKAFGTLTTILPLLTYKKAGPEPEREAVGEKEISIW